MYGNNMKLKDVYKTIRSEFRCPYCHRLLFKGKLKDGCSIEIKCEKCKRICEFNIYMKK